MTPAVLGIIGHFSFGLTALSFLMRDILFLRVLATASCLLGVAYNYFLPEGPLWLVIFWLSVFTMINVIRIALLFIENRSVNFSDEERELYETLFRNFSPVEFMKLMNLGHWYKSVEGEILAIENEPLRDVKLIYNGEVAVERQRREIASLRDGTFIGEMSYLQDSRATATVRTKRPTRYVAWPREDLRKLLKRNPTMDIAMSKLFQLDLARKLGAPPVTEN